jgi:hypothetical protein
MIISHSNKFIFLKTNKTAGTSVEIALSKFCGPEDIITPISPEDEDMRRSLGYRGPQNCEMPIQKYSLYGAVKRLIGRNKMQFYNHITAKEVKAFIGDQVWHDYYKFCIERNPWDRVISLYYHKYKAEPRPTISEFVSSTDPLILRERGYKLYTINGHVAVDKICKFENLSEELEEVRAQLGISEELDLPRAKSKYRKDKRNYQDILGDSDKAKILELFHDEINLCGYNF